MAGKFDAIVIGSGVGGMCAAALLAHGGHRVLLAEKRRYLGGRFSTVDRGGYLCATGGLAVPVGRDMEQVCETVGIPSGVKPSTRVGIWLDGQTYDLSKGATRSIIRQIASDELEAQRVIDVLSKATRQELPPANLSFRDWLNRYTDNPRIHGIFQATISSLLTVNSYELPADQYFRLMKVIAPLRFGFIEGGSIALWDRMAEFIRDTGGDVWTGATAEGIHVTESRVSGVRIRKDRESKDVRTSVVVSNIGPAGTVSLLPDGCMEPEYVERINRDMTPTAIMWLHFSSDELLMNYSAISVGCSRRVNMIDVPSLEAEGVAPAGKHLYTVGAAPRDSLHPGDIKKEFEEVMKDLDEIFPDFEHRCTILTKTCYRGKWPGFRTVPGKHVD
ncbi:MAG: NAD(P)/FAD-dependent oxidoreductase, partial [Gammaproteobacteria bacterium]|nr:NAD(P)/FAD-dependent oxidoreductase [Gammaproteobacteria bacterium]